MIRVLWFDEMGRMHNDLTPEDLPSILAKEAGTLWVDLVETPSDVARPLLSEVFGFHPLAVDDALEETHLPKADDWGDYLYLVFYAMRSDLGADAKVALLELDCFLMPHCFVTYQVRSAPVVDRVWASVQSDPRYANRGATYVLYQLLDTMMNDYMLTLEDFDDQVELAEDQIFEAPTEELLGGIFAYKRGLLHLRRSLAPQREVLNRLSRGDFAAIEEGDRIYFRDIYDHLVRLYDITDTMRDVVNGTLDMYLSVVNNRMNEVMKTLTVITTLFMPLSFLAGFFGMNFFQASMALPAWTGPVALGFTLGAMAVLPLLMYWWMHRRSLI